MEPTFVNKEIVWAKVKGYPWWPAEISKLPTPDSNFFKVVFIAEDTHAFLNPKDVRKYIEFYEECSKKKMRGLAPAIQAADELHRKRLEALNKVPVPNDAPTAKKTKSKQPAKCKLIRKPLRQTSKIESQDSERSQEQDSEHFQQKMEVIPPEVDPGQSFQKQQSQGLSEENMEQDKFLGGESEQRVDRHKIELVQEGLLKIIERIKQDKYTFHEDDFCNLQSLSVQEIILGKITNMLSFIISKQKQDSQEGRYLSKLKQKLKERVMEHLYDTSYYDQYIKLIQKNKKNRNQYECKLTTNLKNHYRLKKEVAVTFANKLMTEINNGTITREKELMQDIQEHRLDIIALNNKAAIDRCIEHLTPKYM